jgi:hypothetical protein
MAFQPGQSGNPAGRPKIVAEVRELAKKKVPAAIEALADIAQDDARDPRTRLAAATVILDRAFGRPKARASPIRERVSETSLCLA